MFLFARNTRQKNIKIKKLECLKRERVRDEVGREDGIYLFIKSEFLGLGASLSLHKKIKKKIFSRSKKQRRALQKVKNN